MRALILILALASCGDDAALSPDAALDAPIDGLVVACGDSSAPPVRVRVVDAAGAPVPADRVRWQGAASADGFWLEAAAATCVGNPPCTEWAIAGSLPERILVTADRYREGVAVPGRPTCVYYATTVAHVGALARVPSVPQVLALTLPDDSLWCDDGPGGMAFGPEGSDTFHAVTTGDCVAEPDPVTGALAVQTVDTSGEPLPATRAYWYYPPKSPDYDGEHPLTCADARCTRWVATEAPRPGMIYIAANAAGPTLPAFYVDDIALGGYGARPVDFTGTAVTEMLTIELVYSTTPDPK